MVWLDNLKFVLDYNARHTSHWVRRRRCRRLLLPGFHARHSRRGARGRRWLQGAVAAAPGRRRHCSAPQRTACLPMRRRPTHCASAAAPCPFRACSWA